MVTLHVLARQYGCRPSEIAAGSFIDYMRDVQVLEAGLEEEGMARKRMAHDAARKARIGG